MTFQHCHYIIDDCAPIGPNSLKRISRADQKNGFHLLSPTHIGLAKRTMLLLNLTFLLVLKKIHYALLKQI